MCHWKERTLIGPTSGIEYLFHVIVLFWKIEQNMEWVPSHEGCSCPIGSHGSISGYPSADVHDDELSEPR